MKRKHIVVGVAFAIVIAIPTILIVHRSRRTAGLDELLTDRGFAAGPCALPEPVVERPSKQVCYVGAMAGHRTTVVFASRYRAGYVPKGSRVALDSYVGIFVELADDPAWLTAWKQRVVGAGDGRAPFRAVRSGSNMLLAWTGPWSVDDARTMLAAVEGSLPKPAR